MKPSALVALWFIWQFTLLPIHGMEFVGNIDRMVSIQFNGTQQIPVQSESFTISCFAGESALYKADATNGAIYDMYIECNPPYYVATNQLVKWAAKNISMVTVTNQPSSSFAAQKSVR